MSMAGVANSENAARSVSPAAVQVVREGMLKQAAPSMAPVVAGSASTALANAPAPGSAQAQSGSLPVFPRLYAYQKQRAARQRDEQKWMLLSVELYLEPLTK